jgi:hypothetical protein
MTGDSDTTHGVLTTRQREFLRGEVEYGGKYPEQQRYQMRQRIKERAAAGMSDFSLLLEHIDDLPEGVDQEGSVDALAFFFAQHLHEDTDEARAERAAEIDGKKPVQYATDGDQIAFLEFVAERALGRAADARDHNRRYDVEITPRDQDPRSKLELKQAIEAGALSRDTFEEMYHDGLVGRDKFVSVMADVGEE